MSNVVRLVWLDNYMVTMLKCSNLAWLCYFALGYLNYAICSNFSTAAVLGCAGNMLCQQYW